MYEILIGVYLDAGDIYTWPPFLYTSTFLSFILPEGLFIAPIHLLFDFSPLQFTLTVVVTYKGTHPLGDISHFILIYLYSCSYIVHFIL